MEQQRLMLFVALAFIMFLMFDAWNQDKAEKEIASNTRVANQASNQVATTPSSSSSQVTQAIKSGEIPVAESNPQPVASPSTVPSTQSAEIFQKAQTIKIVTDVLNVSVSTVGGDIRQVKLLDYPAKLNEHDNPFLLMNDTLPRVFIAQSGFTGKTADANTIITAPNHLNTYRADRTNYVLEESKDSMDVSLYWMSPEGVQFTKTYTFQRGSHKVNVKHTVENRSNKTWRGNAYYQLQRTQVSEVDQSQFIYTYMGGVLYSPEERYEKIDFADIQETKLKRDITGGWAAMIQHYFLSAWVPNKDQTKTYYTAFKARNTIYTIGFRDKNETHVVPGETKTFDTVFYAGPKDQDELEKIAQGLELTVDYGVLTIIAKPIFIALTYIHKVVGNWGWAIILLTIFIKLIFYKLSEASYKSMAKMRAVQPRMVAMKERFADDRQGMNKAMMDLYKKEKINPLGGCLPILVQIPVFIALYWVLLESVELRQAPWILWIEDMSAADPYLILPILMAVSMYIQQKLNPAPIDPVQAKVMMALPFVFGIFFMFFPAGLVLYWVVNNVLSIAQQWYITNKVMGAKK